MRNNMKHRKVKPSVELYVDLYALFSKIVVHEAADTNHAKIFCFQLLLEEVVEGDILLSIMIERNFLRRFA